MIVAMILAALMGTADSDTSHYDAAMLCIVAINQADAMDQALAGKATSNTEKLRNIREAYRSVLLFEGMRLGRTRVQIGADFKTQQDAAPAISKSKTAAELKATYDTVFKKAADCSDRI